jgi:hypothetical protein
VRKTCHCQNEKCVRNFFSKGIIKRRDNLRDLDSGKLTGPNRNRVRRYDADLAGSECRQIASFYQLCDESVDKINNLGSHGRLYHGVSFILSFRKSNLIYLRAFYGVRNSDMHGKGKKCLHFSPKI